MPHPKTETAVRRSGTAVMIGRTNVGKSTLLNAALREKLAIVTPTPQTTRDRILGVVRHGDAQIALMDTPGMHKPHSHLGRTMNAIAREAVRGADVMIFVTALPTRSVKALGPHPADQVLLQDLGRLRQAAGFRCAGSDQRASRRWGERCHARGGQAAARARSSI